MAFSPASSQAASRAKNAFKPALTEGCAMAQMAYEAAMTRTDPVTPNAKRLHCVIHRPTAPTKWSFPQPAIKPVSTSKLKVSSPTVHGSKRAATHTLRNALPICGIRSGAINLTPAARHQAPNKGAATPNPPRMKVKAQRAPNAPRILRKLPSPASVPL